MTGPCTAAPPGRGDPVRLAPVVTAACDGTGRVGTVTVMGSERDDGALSATDREMLDLEAQRWKYAGAKEAAVRERFGWPMSTYQLRLNDLLDRPEAAVYAPVLVARLRRLRAARRGPGRPADTATPRPDRPTWVLHRSASSRRRRPGLVAAGTGWTCEAPRRDGGCTTRGQP
jgi:hypothetical protein